MDGFIIIGNMNAITYKEIFPYIKNNQLWIGYRSLGSEFYFNITDDYKTRIVKEKKEGSGWKEINGIICGRVANACWFTNCPVYRKPLVLTKTYDPEKYPKYDNYDAIEVGKVTDIPKDYDGVMGVPISFLGKYCPSQFELVDISPHFFSLVEQGFEKPKQLSLKSYGMKDPYVRILIRKKVSE